MFLKLYSGQQALSALAGVDPETFRKWTWQFIEGLLMLEHLVVRTDCVDVLSPSSFVSQLFFLCPFADCLGESFQARQRE